MFFIVQMVHLQLFLHQILFLFIVQQQNQMRYNKSENQEEDVLV